MSVEEIIEQQRLKDGLAAQMTGTEPVVVEAPVVPVMEDEPLKASVVRLDSPPVGVIPTDQTPTKTLLPEEVDGGRRDVSQILEEAGIEPLDELLAMYNERVDDPGSKDHGKFVMSPGERRALMKELLKYKHPQLKSVEHTGNGGDNRVVVVLQMPDGTQKSHAVEARGKVIDA